MTPIEQIDRRIRAFLGGIRLAFRGVITLVKAAGAVQLVQMDALAGEQLQDAELFQHYGLTSHPPAGTMAIVLPIGGRTAHGVIVATEHGTWRLKNLAPGEMAVYDDLGQRVYLKRNGIEIHSPQNIILRTDGVLRLDGEHVEIHGRTSLQTDVHGKGSRETWTGGTHWHSDSYTDAHTADATEQGLAMPAVPSDHPEGA